MPRSSSDRSDEAVDVTVQEDITYADREAGAMKLDLYVPETESPPLVVYFHGGGWVLETRKNTPDLERYAAEWDVAFASVSYRLAEIPDGVDPAFQPEPDNPTPRGTFPAQIVDAKAAIRWLRANADTYGFDADEVAVWGSSAGGHVACLAGTLTDVEDLAGLAYPAETVRKEVAPDQSGAVQAIVAWYPVTDLLELSYRKDSLESVLIGGPIADNHERARLASPVRHVTDESPPALLIHGQPDEVVPVEQSRLLFDALRDARVDATLYELQDLGHGFYADSERTAMSQLTAEPRPAQSVLAAAHHDEGDGGGLDEHPPAGPQAIADFLDRTLR